MHDNTFSYKTRNALSEQYYSERCRVAIFNHWKDLGTKSLNAKKNAEFVEKMLEKNSRVRCFAAWKMFTHSYSNRVYERKCKRAMHAEVVAKVEEKKGQLEFLEQMVNELEEKYRVELRKKTILKQQCDQAYLRGVSAISQEALKLSNSTLDDYYRGMKMPSYDGKNIYTQMRVLNSAAGTLPMQNANGIKDESQQSKQSAHQQYTLAHVPVQRTSKEGAGQECCNDSVCEFDKSQ